MNTKPTTGDLYDHVVRHGPTTFQGPDGRLWTATVPAASQLPGAPVALTPAATADSAVSGCDCEDCEDLRSDTSEGQTGDAR